MYPVIDSVRSSKVKSDRASVLLQTSVVRIRGV